MVANLPGPYEIEYSLTGWSAPARQHVFRVSVAAVGNPAAGSLPTAVDIQKMGGGTAKLNVVANQLWEFVRLFYPVAITCSGYTLWKYVPGTLGKDFRSAGAVTNVAGSGAAIAAASQIVHTFRSAFGGVMKIQLMETSFGGSNRITLVPNGAGVAYQRLAAYVLSADNIVLARDDSYPVAAMNVASSENEALFRLLYR